MKLIMNSYRCAGVTSLLILLITVDIGNVPIGPVMLSIFETTENHWASIVTDITIWNKKTSEFILKTTSIVRMRSGFCLLRCYFSIS